MTRRLIYHPKGTRRDPRPTDFVLTRGNIELRGTAVNPGRRRGLIYFGGNAEGVERWSAPFAAAFPDHTIYLVAYRGYGASSGRPTQRHLVGDAIALHELAAARHPQAGIDVIGRSLGSAVAMQVCARAEVRRLVLVTPLDSAVAVAEDQLPSWAARLLIRDRWDSVAASPDVRVPTLILRAGSDTTILPPRTDALVSAMPSARVVAFSSADHGTITEQADYLREIQAFLQGDDES